jgi:hypothetical protein
MLGAVRIVVAEEPAKDKVTLKQFTNSISMRMVPIKAGFSRASERLCGPPWMPRCAGSPRLPVPDTHRRPDGFRCGGRESKF